MNKQTASDNSEDLNIYALWQQLRPRLRMITIAVFIVGFVTAGITMFLPKYFKSEAIILPAGLQGRGGLGLGASTTSAASQLGLVGGLLSSFSGELAASGRILALLKSRTLAEKAIEKLSLQPYYFPNSNPLPEDVVERFFKSVAFTSDKKLGIIRITGEFKNPELAANVVNTYLDLLQQHIQENIFSSEKRNRIFIETQLTRNRIELLEADRELNSFYKNKNVSSLEATIDIPVGHLMTQSNLDSLNQSLLDVSSKIERAKVLKNVPQQVYLNYLKMRVDILNSLQSILTREFEMAKIEEVRESLSFEIVDRGIPAGRKSWPPRLFITLCAMVAVAFILVLGVYVSSYWRHLRALAGDELREKISDNSLRIKTTV